MQADPVVILSAVRTPTGKLLGTLKDVSATDLGAAAIKVAIERAHLPSSAIEEVIMGCVLPAGLGQAPARQAALAAGVPISAACVTLNKVCGSGMKAVMIANDEILAGSYNVIAAGGMESMSNSPHLLMKSRHGYRLGHNQIIDHMYFDGLEDAYDKGRLMGTFAEECVKQFKFTREQQDHFAMASLQRAHDSSDQGLFKNEIAPVKITNRQGDLTIEQDELPDIAKLNNIPKLKPAFGAEGTITAANSSSISDGAAAVILMKKSEAAKRQLKPLAALVAHSTHSQEPANFTTAPIGAIQKLLQKTGWKIEDVDLFEINEAFAVVTLAAMHELKIPHEKVNIHGGACALGHPLGASGARVLVTLIHALKQKNLKRGIATLCIGGGEATAIAIEIL